MAIAAASAIRLALARIRATMPLLDRAPSEHSPWQVDRWRR
jgi:hypothetical protein